VTQDSVLIAGAGPVGLTAAALLARAGVPVTVLEAGDALSLESRASTFHPPTLDMLEEIGATRQLTAQGLVAPILQYRTRDELLASFDFALLADVTRHPYRLQAEQFKLTSILLDLASALPAFQIRFGARVETVTQDAASVIVHLAGGETLRGAWLIGADGASSPVRKAVDIAFDGFTWDERFLVVSTPFDFAAAVPGLASVSYVADPRQWHFFLQIPGLWRMMFPVLPDVSDIEAVSDAYVQAQMATLIPGRHDYDVSHTTLYRVHQRTAAHYRAGRVFLAGDAAHVNNPLGGMGMNGGIHDAVSIANRLAAVWQGKTPESSLDLYERQRRTVNLEYVQAQTIRNKQNLEARDPQAHQAFRDRMRRLTADPAQAHAYLLEVAMINSLTREAELAQEATA
jgi:3-(3-hydroxy-phenyl)propionate hydroxylase